MNATEQALRTHEQTLEWLRSGTTLFHDTVDSLRNSDLGAASGLPGWSRRHVLAHVCSNAEALDRLAHWASTGVPTPMYPSPEARATEIEAGARLAPDFLRTWSVSAAEALEESLSLLTDEQWGHEVTTAQGRRVPASEVPWMRAREVMVHAVDLDAGVTMRDLPADFLVALVDDVVSRRSSSGDGPALAIEATDPTGHRWEVAGSGRPRLVTGGPAALAAWLTGRPGGRVRSGDENPAPTLPPWL